MERSLAGKDYNKSLQVYKITLQAMWQLLLPQLLVYMEEKDNELQQGLERCVRLNTEDDFLKLLDLLIIC